MGLTLEWLFPRPSWASGPPPGHFSEQERERLVAGGGGSRFRIRPGNHRGAQVDNKGLPLWVTIFLVVTVTLVWSATYIAAILNPKFSPDGFVGPAILAIIPLVSTYHIVVNRRGRDE